MLFLVPARGGSKGLPGKNLRAVGGIPLVGRAVRTARLAAARLDGSGHRVVCSTDDLGIATVARAWGAEVPFLRPPALATDSADSADVALHAIDWLADHAPPFRALALLQPTSPLARPEHAAQAVRLFFEGDGSPVATVSPSHHPFWTYRVEAGRLRPLLPSLADVPRRQDVAPCFALNGAVFVVDPDGLRRTRRFVEPERTIACVMPAEHGIDVDDEADLGRCEAVLARQPVAEIRLGQRLIGPGHPCFVIAEAGVNHNGDVAMAHRLVEAAAECRADAVKFQTFDPALLAADRAPLARYQERASGAGGSQRRMLQELVLSESAHASLKAHAEERGLVFLSSPFDEPSADFLDGLGVVAFKVPSGEAVNLPFLVHVARKGRPLLLSTGMCDMREVADAVDVIRGAGDPPLALLHCVSNYPAEVREANLRAMATLRHAFAVPVGWSDHTTGAGASLAAVALGASLVERHLTLDQRLPGPDHRASLEPDEFRRMVAAAREVELALGASEKAPQPSERAIAAVARKSLHWRVSLPVGARVEEGHLIALRPGTGMPPSRLASVIGRRLARGVEAGTMVEERDLEPAS